MSKGIFVTGIGTEIGKTVVASVLVETLRADYWKPLQSGDLDWSDTMKVQSWTTVPETSFHRERYRLTQPMSPHASAELDGLTIDIEDFALPATGNFLVVEGAGGLLVPLNDQHTMLDLLQRLELPAVLVARHFLGSINQTLLSLQRLESSGLRIAALVYSGEPHPSSEAAINAHWGGGPILRIPEISPSSTAISEVAALRGAEIREVLGGA